MAVKKKAARSVVPGMSDMSAALAVLRNDGMLIDEGRWDDWLALYAPEAEFWIPAWRTDEDLTADPQTQLSHIYYAGRAGLEDRVMRLRTQRSPASVPLSRTSHMIGNTAPADPAPALPEGHIRLRSAGPCHVYFLRGRDSHPFFGRVEHELRPAGGGGWLIAKKKVVLVNDFIPSLLDFYCV